MIALWLWLGLALALAEDAPACDQALTPPAGDLSVAWVSPLRETVGRSGWLEVVRTSDLRQEVSGGRVGVGRVLQLLGLRKKASDPKKRYKVTIFEVNGADLCRPLVGYDEPAAVEGAVTCPPRLGKVTRSSDGCGWTTDRADGEPGLETFRVRWEDAARNGFCVLPAERFVSPSR